MRRLNPCVKFLFNRGTVPINLFRVSIAWMLFILAIAWPTLALFIQIIQDAQPPTDGFLFSARQFALLWRSVWLSTTSALLCVMIALPVSFFLGMSGRKFFRPRIIAILASLLICPPMVYAFSWEKLLPANFDPYVRCVLVWTLWAWPIPTMILGSGWARTGKSMYEAARLDMSATKAFVIVIFSTLRPHIGLSFLIVWVLFVTNYDVPHASGLIVFTTELLGWASNSSLMIDTAWPATLPLILITLSLVAMYCLFRRPSLDIKFDSSNSEIHHPSHRSLLLLYGVFILAWILPMGGLISTIKSINIFALAYQSYASDLLATIGVAVLSGLLALVMGLGIFTTHKNRSAILWWAVVMGVLPGALIGKTLIAAYNHSTTAYLFDHWPIMVISYLTRFGWIGILAVYIAARQSRPGMFSQSQTDGADDSQFMTNILIPMSWPVLLSGAGLVAALSIGDVASTTLMRVPDYSPISLIIIEKFHRFEDGMLVSLSLSLVFTCMIIVGLISWAWNRSNPR